jgi:hypothetical protein
MQIYVRYITIEKHQNALKKKTKKKKRRKEEKWKKGESIEDRPIFNNRKTPTSYTAAPPITNILFSPSAETYGATLKFMQQQQIY